MGFMTPIKANKAYRLQQKGQREEAKKLYEEAFAEGLNDPRYNLAYALLIIRDGEYQKAKDFLVKHQKAPGMTQEQRVTLLVDYAACWFRLGNVDKAIDMLSRFAETAAAWKRIASAAASAPERSAAPESFLSGGSFPGGFMQV